MSNFFAALDDSGDEGLEQVKKAPPQKPVIVEPSKVPSRRRTNDDRNTRQGRGGRQAPREGKRAYDRRSGTGRGREIKKGGGGARNWGSDKNDARAAEGVVDEAEVETAVEETKEGGGDEHGAGEEKDAGADGEKTNDDEADKQVAEQVEEKDKQEEDKTISYEEYMKLKENERNESEAFQALTVKEVEVDDAFKGKIGAKKSDEEFILGGGGKQPRKKGKAKKEKETLVPSFRVGSSGSGGRGRGRRDGRGGRGQGRREGGRGGDRRDARSGEGRGSFGSADKRSVRERGNNQDKPDQIDVGDPEAFPSL